MSTCLTPQTLVWLRIIVLILLWLRPMLQNIQKTHAFTIQPLMCISNLTIQLRLTWVYFQLVYILLLIMPLHVCQLVLTSTFGPFAHIAIGKGLLILKATHFIPSLLILASVTLIT